MVEFFLSLGLAATLLAGVAGVLGAEWDRTRCSVIAFESAHRRLVGDERPSLAFLASLGKRPGVRVSETEATVTTEAACGRALERVELVKLEAARW